MISSCQGDHQEAIYNRDLHTPLCRNVDAGLTMYCCWTAQIRGLYIDRFPDQFSPYECRPGCQLPDGNLMLNRSLYLVSSHTRFSSAHLISCHTRRLSAFLSQKDTSYAGTDCENSRKCAEGDGQTLQDRSSDSGGLPEIQAKSPHRKLLRIRSGT